MAAAGTSQVIRVMVSSQLQRFRYPVPAARFAGPRAGAPAKGTRAQAGPRGRDRRRQARSNPRVPHTAAACLTISLSREDPDAEPKDQRQVMADSAIYTCRDGKRMAIATLEDHYWPEFLRLATSADHPLRSARYASRMGRDADKVGLAALLSDLFAEHDREDWILLLAAGRVPVVPVWEGIEALDDDHLRFRGAIAHWSQGDTSFRYPSFPAIINGERDQDVSNSASPVTTDPRRLGL
jgi:crotonobetainyl-CoA:carnitine CoA-transferase CaiB-like acyl-CoA transferase